MKLDLNIKTLFKANIFAFAILCIVLCSDLKLENAKAGIEVESAVTQTEANESTIEPEQLYQRVWDLIRKDYVDQTFNGQDWNIWKNRYKGKLKTLEDAHKAIETMLVSLGDRYTRFLSKKDFEDEKQAINAKLSGIVTKILLFKGKSVIELQLIKGILVCKHEH